MSLDDVLKALVGSGPLGGICVMLWLKLWAKIDARDKELAECQAARIADLQRMLTEKHNS